mmetsp:Transcript_47670/g.103758  ORF Transcript_47670/g.103758 Transcript_47670/m.103758 type:complete len:228 (+) Transcript_47670:940-1623(+)
MSLVRTHRRTSEFTVWLTKEQHWNPPPQPMFFSFFSSCTFWYASATFSLPDSSSTHWLAPSTPPACSPMSFRNRRRLAWRTTSSMAWGTMRMSSHRSVVSINQGRTSTPLSSRFPRKAAMEWFTGLIVPSSSVWKSSKSSQSTWDSRVCGTHRSIVSSHVPGKLLRSAAALRSQKAKPLATHERQLFWRLVSSAWAAWASSGEILYRGFPKRRSQEIRGVTSQSKHS